MLEEKELKTLLKTLNDCGLLENIIIIGSWALFFYKQMYCDFQSQLMTTDLDLYIPNKRNLKTCNITNELRHNSYIRYDDFLSNKTIFVSDKDFKIEFLTKYDRTMNNSINIEKINIYAEALNYISLLEINEISVNYKEYKVRVPNPASFVLHKLLISKDRSEEKQLKDLDSILYIVDKFKNSLDFKSTISLTFKELPKKWKKKIIQTVEKYEIVKLKEILI